MAHDASLFTIALSGDDGVPFSGTCKAETADGPIEFALEGVVPHSRKLRARGVSCRLAKGDVSGRLTVEIRKNGQIRSRSTVSGSSGQVHISVY